MKSWKSRVIRPEGAELQLALDEGEGFESAAEWRAAHEHFWADEIQPTLSDPVALRLDAKTGIVVERFRVVE